MSDPYMLLSTTTSPPKQQIIPTPTRPEPPSYHKQPQLLSAHPPTLPLNPHQQHNRSHGDFHLVSQLVAMADGGSSRQGEWEAALGKAVMGGHSQKR